MPNHITNIVKILSLGSSTIEQVKKCILNDEGDIDFKVIFKMPLCLEDFNPHDGIITLADAELESPISGNPMIGNLQMANRRVAIAKKYSISDEDRKLVDRAIRNHKECGFSYWYEWTCATWGTKWNAYDQTVESDYFKFDTAWSHPKKIIDKISENLPDVEFSIQYADEDTGSNCGSYIIKGGVRSSEDIAPSWHEMSDEEKRRFRKFAFLLRYPNTDHKDHGFDENWDYIEED